MTNFALRFAIGAVVLLESTVVQASSYGFVTKANGRLGEQIRFEFYSDRLKLLLRDLCTRRSHSTDMAVMQWKFSSSERTAQ